MKDKICGYCTKSIDTNKDRYVSLITNEGKKVIEEGYYHIKCFQDWFNSAIVKRIQKGQELAMKMVGSMFNKIHEIKNEA